ncbi:stage III sporulation protein SpoIIIAB [Clostridium hydrogeniformans]|uniref:stage III sporulation protein SpoIIIAB n=1 Tax=Clostridium hydrogeniformans TaxID=349933 RepID=UPI0006892BA8|nr:stage III sporulation protein SpoIIIAB [Clostridium hydrogeniformans]
MIFKIIGFSLILIACTLGGFIYGQSFLKREEELKDLERALVDLENEILYIQEPLPYAFLSIGEKNKGNIKNIFLFASSLLSEGEVEGVYEALDKALEKYNDLLSLSKGDRSILLNLSKNLGAIDREGHKKIFSLTSSELKIRIREAHEESLKSSKMYRALGVSLGLTIVIFLI